MLGRELNLPVDVRQDKPSFSFLTVFRWRVTQRIRVIAKHRMTSCKRGNGSGLDMWCESFQDLSIYLLYVLA